MLEKPISPVKEELLQLLDATKNSTSKIMVCHVLRYAPGFVKIKELLDSGVIGKLIRVETIEQVAFWHQAHSFVRGNWQNDQDTSPMIMQKCCHDLDLIQYYVGAKCEKVYSVGDLSFFKKENQPEGASDRCYDCKFSI
ncbi:MAG: Gfo/Idh/MocA family oxidoreductase [Clostridia bacterium]|nr:Gfo/Idh/MocA family oxidoreductase [Clostridia bacterium]